MFVWLKKHFFPILLGGYFVYLILLIYRTSFVIDGVRYFSLVDDMMISMKYAKLFAEGHGLVWNIGDRVEGFTNPLWTMYMAVIHLLPIASSKISLVIQLTNVLFLLLNLIVIKKIASLLSKNSFFVVLFSLILTASYYPLNNYAVLGIEVTVLTLLTSLVALFVTQQITTKKYTGMVFFILGIATLVRIDMAVLFGSTVLFLFLFDKKNREKVVKSGVVYFLLFVGLQTGVRYMYYHELFPNTYYLKMTGYPILFRMTRGAYTLLKFVWDTGLILFIIPLTLFPKVKKEILFIFWILFFQILYTIYTGGDVFYYFGRYVMVTVPLFFVLFALSSERILQSIAQVLNIKKHVFAMSFIFIIVSVSMFNFVDKDMFLESLLLKHPQSTGGIKQNVELVRAIDTVTYKGAKVAVIWAGITPYFSDRYFYDMLGKSDKVIAHEENKNPKELADVNRLIRFVPGHLKYDYDYSIKTLRPDVVTNLYFEREQIIPYMEKNYELKNIDGVNLYLKKNSKFIKR